MGKKGTQHQPEGVKNNQEKKAHSRKKEETGQLREGRGYSNEKKMGGPALNAETGKIKKRDEQNGFMNYENHVEGGKKKT